MSIVERKVAYKDGDTALEGILAYDDAVKEKRPGVLVVHEWWGITKHVKDYTRDLASKGYAAFAVDMYGGKTADNPQGATELMNALMGHPKLVRSRFDAGMKALASQAIVDSSRIAAVGFCMGGKIVLDMARAGLDLKAVASFHGILDTHERAKPGVVKARILVGNGADDPFVKRESVDAFKKEMDAAKVDYCFIDYPGVVHGFTNPDATQKGEKFNLPLKYDADADRKSRADALDLFEEAFR
jgi:dienelactone hydrolase